MNFFNAFRYFISVIAISNQDFSAQKCQNLKKLLKIRGLFLSKKLISLIVRMRTNRGSTVTLYIALWEFENSLTDWPKNYIFQLLAYLLWQNISEQIKIIDCFC